MSALRQSDNWAARRVWSLWDLMHKFAAGNCPEVFALLMQLAQVASFAPEEEITSGEKQRILLVLYQVAMIAADAEAKRAVEMVSRHTKEFERKVTKSEFMWFVHSFMPVLTSEMDEKTFLLLTDASDYEKPAPFGQSAYDAFPSAQYDVSEASNCFALERYSASVHHSMSALEPGLKVLAVDVGAAVNDGMWKGVLDRIESKIESLKKTLPRGAARNDRLQFLSAAAKEFFYFKDGWRNYIAHAKAQYDREQALGAMNHVGAFMRHLATKLHE